jgi:DNA helicase-2/ATP-dependent DNA helicase PcrA
VVDRIAEQGWDPRALAAFAPPPRAQKAHAALVQLFDALRAASSTDSQQPVSAEIALLRTLYDDILRERYDRPEPRLADLDHLEVIAANFPSRTAFLAELALEPPSTTQDLAGAGEASDDALILSTAHSAKGREWDAVFVIWAVDGAFPSAHALRSADELEEERRLMYVAMTRARHHLAVLYPVQAFATRFAVDYSTGQLSRFIDPGVREGMQCIAAVPAAAPTAGANDAAPATPLDLRAMLRARFGGA